MQANALHFRRYAIYFVPQTGAWARFGASWLGWDIETGRDVAQPDLALPLDEITRTPRRYGLHGTIVPPFRMAGDSPEKYCNFVRFLGSFCTKCRPVTFSGLELAALGRFLALLPVGDGAALRHLAAEALRLAAPFRAAASAEDLARYRARGLSPAQKALLRDWGYPYVMEEFRFHITLTGKLPKPLQREARAVLAREIAPILPRPFVIDQLALVGEDAAGRFHLIERFGLGG